MAKVRDRMKITVSLWKTFVFFLICVFFKMVAGGFELKYSIRFNRVYKYRKYSTEKLKSTLADFGKLALCEDPYIENFVEKHPELSAMNSRCLFTSSWIDKIKNELKRRGEIVA